jgi:phosphohistidine phosphatase
MESKWTRRLVLLRHAKSAWPEGVPDQDRPLGRRGQRDAPASGRWLRSADCVPDLVLCSTARRARETWELAQGELGAVPSVTYEPRVYEASATGLLELVRGLPPTARTVAVVGHSPGLPDLALALAGSDSGHAGQESPSAALDRMRAKFPTAAIAVFEISPPWSELISGGARLASFVTPRDMALADHKRSGGRAAPAGGRRGV